MTKLESEFRKNFPALENLQLNKSNASCGLSMSEILALLPTDTRDIELIVQEARVLFIYMREGCDACYRCDYTLSHKQQIGRDVVNFYSLVGIPVVFNFDVAECDHSMEDLTAFRPDHRGLERMSISVLNDRIVYTLWIDQECRQVEVIFG